MYDCLEDSAGPQPVLNAVHVPLAVIQLVLKSEVPAPEDTAGPVAVVKGDTFQDIVSTPVNAGSECWAVHL